MNAFHFHPIAAVQLDGTSQTSVACAVSTFIVRTLERRTIQTLKPNKIFKQCFM